MKLLKSPDNWLSIVHLKYEEFVISILKNKNLNINFQNNLGETPLHICCKYGYVDKFYTLIYMGANYKIVTIKGENILHYASFYSKDIFLTQEIAKKYINPLEKNNDGKNAINICNNIQDVIYFQNWAKLHKIPLDSMGNILTSLALTQPNSFESINDILNCQVENKQKSNFNLSLNMELAVNSKERLKEEV